jgi:uncharacterized protein YecT (DUF1311 family)
MLALFCASAGAQGQAGAIAGVIGFPSEEIPALRIYALAVDGKSHYMVDTARKQAKFSIPGIAAGRYFVVAYIVVKTESEIDAGGWTRFVPCGMNVRCSDHALIPVVVAAGETASGVNVADWYAPAGTFPPEPVRASAAAPTEGCSGKGSQMEEDACNLKAYEAADRTLNAQYRRLMAALDKLPRCRERLREAQRAWIRFRDEHCRYEGATGYKGRTTECLVEMTAQRAGYLKHDPETCNP